MFLGWYDPDKKRSVAQKVAEGLERYREKFGSEPVVVILNASDLVELRGKQDPHWLPDYVYRGVTYVPRHTFYVGVED